MKKFYTLLSVLLVAAGLLFTAPARAQHEDFSPYKGICWGLFYDATGENLLNYMVPVEYVRPTWDKFVLIDFVSCGKDLIININHEPNEDPEYYDLTLEMEDARYDDKGYFYAPFSSGNFNWTIAAPYNELMGPIHQPSCYYHDPLEYIGLFYVRYPEQQFGYFDIKTQEDFYDDVPRTYISEDEAAMYTGVKTNVLEKSSSSSVYDLIGRVAPSATKGLRIENGRKIIR